MPVLNDATAVYRGTAPVDIIYAGTVRIWPEVPPPQWQPVGTFRPFDWFHANSSRVPTFYPPISNDPGCTCTFDRNADTLTINIPTSFIASSLGASFIVEWPAATAPMPHPDPRNPSGYKLRIDGEWTISSSGLESDLHTCWAYWSSSIADDSETYDHWGIWEMRGRYPHDADPSGTRTAPNGCWTLAAFNLIPRANINAGTIKLKSPSMTWLQLLPVAEDQ